MNIAMISEHASPLAVLGGADAGGQNVHVAEISAALVRAGHSVCVYTRRDDARSARRVTMPTGVVVEHIDAGPAAAVPKDELFPLMETFARRLRSRFAGEPPDIIHAHFWMSGRVALAARPTNVPVVHTFHALGSEKRRMLGAADTSPADRILQEEQILKSVDRIIATSSSEIFELCRLGADPRRLKLIPCGVDVAAFETIRDESVPRRRQCHRIVTLSRLVERKGIGDVIAALAEIPDTELLVAGGPAKSDLQSDADARRLELHAREIGVADRVRFLGRVDRETISAVLHSADVVACAAWYEPFGIVPLEAMAAARPVVATAVGGQKDTVLDGYTGIHVPPRQPKALAHAIRELLADPEKRHAFGASGRERVQQRFSWERIARETFTVYRSLARISAHEEAFTA